MWVTSDACHLCSQLISQSSSYGRCPTSNSFGWGRTVSLGACDGGDSRVSGDQYQVFAKMGKSTWLSLTCPGRSSFWKVHRCWCMVGLDSGISSNSLGIRVVVDWLGLSRETEEIEDVCICIYIERFMIRNCVTLSHNYRG